MGDTRNGRKRTAGTSASRRHRENGAISGGNDRVPPERHIFSLMGDNGRTHTQAHASTRTHTHTPLPPGLNAGVCQQVHEVRRTGCLPQTLTETSGRRCLWEPIVLTHMWLANTHQQMNFYSPTEASTITTFLCIFWGVLKKKTTKQPFRYENIKHNHAKTHPDKNKKGLLYGSISD